MMMSIQLRGKFRWISIQAAAILLLAVGTNDAQDLQRASFEAPTARPELIAFLAPKPGESFEAVEFSPQVVHESHASLNQFRDAIQQRDEAGVAIAKVEEAKGGQGVDEAASQQGFVPDQVEVGGKLIIDTDDRQLPGSAYPFRCVGKLITKNHTATASLVGDRLILTASHCVPWQPDGSIGQCVFVPYFLDGKANFGRAHVVRWHYYQPITDKNYNDDGAVSWDVAIGVLDQPVGQRIGYLGYRPFNDEWFDNSAFVVAGYSGDFYQGYRMGAHIGAAIRDRDGPHEDELVLLHDGDTISGASGGPIFSKFGDDYQIVAVHSGHRPADKRKVPNWTRNSTNLAVDCERWGVLLTKLRKQYD